MIVYLENEPALHFVVHYYTRCMIVTMASQQTQHDMALGREKNKCFS